MGYNVLPPPENLHGHGGQGRAVFGLYERAAKGTLDRVHHPVHLRHRRLTPRLGPHSLPLLGRSGPAGDQVQYSGTFHDLIDAVRREAGIISRNIALSFDYHALERILAIRISARDLDESLR